MKDKIIRNKVRMQVRRNLKDFVLISLGILAAGLGLKGFLIPNKFIDGGVTGISLLLTGITELPVSIFIVALNIPFIIIGYYQVSKIFAFKTILAISGLAVSLLFIPYPIITNDKLLISVFGGFSLGTGIGLAIRGGCVIDGTEILALYLSKKFSITVGDVILLINILIFSSAAMLLGIEAAFYSILTYLAASRTVDFIIEGIEEYIGVTIISDQSEKIQRAIIHNIGRGVTIYSGKKGFGKRGEVERDLDIIFTVVTRLEISKLNNVIELVDDKAFVVQHRINDTRGGMIKKRPLH
ncbi:MAG: YitT family protein [Ignavibacteria bacterium]|nr:YitT family protein [Ignavibacteria bacterium]